MDRFYRIHFPLPYVTSERDKYCVRFWPRLPRPVALPANPPPVRMPTGKRKLLRRQIGSTSCRPCRVWAGGSIVNISSVVSTLGFPNASVYSGTKGAVDSITRSLAKELGRRGIRVNAINPGMVVSWVRRRQWRIARKADPRNPRSAMSCAIHATKRLRPPIQLRIPEQTLSKQRAVNQ